MPFDQNSEGAETPFQVSGGRGVKMGGGQHQHSCTGFGNNKVMNETPVSPHANDKGETDKYIATALQGMSLEDRNELYRDIHGVVDHLVQETTTMLTESFSELQQELFRIVHTDGTIGSRMDPRPFQIAEQRNHSYVHSRFHYLMFLRSEKFDIPKAGSRMVYFFQLKALLFGEKSLCVDIHQGMLSKREIECLKKGFLQILPTRDQSGRVLAEHFFNAIEFDTPEGLGRIYFYLSCLCSLDEESQRKGTIMIQWDLSEDKAEAKDTKQMNLFGNLSLQLLLMLGCPVRTVVFHNCISDQLYLVLSWGFNLLPKDFQARCKVHSGSTQERICSLLTYGIPSDVHPIGPEGDIKTRRHREWLKSCATLESWIRQGKLHSATASVPVREIVIIPATNDVLLGRGKRSIVHPGSVQLNRLVDETMEEYLSGTKAVKTAITIRLIAQVKEEFQGRFLEQDAKSGVWLIASDDIVRLRISQRFRARKQEVEEEVAKAQGHQSQHTVLDCLRALGSSDGPPAQKRVKGEPK